jgi:hypothetical protein
MLWTPSVGEPVFLGFSLETSTAWIETKALHVGDPAFTYYLDRIVSHIPDLDTHTNLWLEVYGADDENGPFELLDEFQLYRENPSFTDADGKQYYKFRWNDREVMGRWQLAGFEIYGEAGGEEF